jgi:hypothetical protein
MSDDFTVITSIEDVRKGDIAVMRSGNRYAVLRTDKSTMPLLVNSIEDGTHRWLYRSEFDHAERAKPKVPTAPGFYRDKDGDIWGVSGVGARMIEVAGKTVIAGGTTKALSEVLAPYAPVHFEPGVTAC